MELEHKKQEAEKMSDTKSERPRLEYLKYVFNNLELLLADKNGSRCVYCLGAPVITRQTQTCDQSTVLCPLCGIDAVVPASVCNMNLLRKWHADGFTVH